MINKIVIGLLLIVIGMYLGDEIHYYSINKKSKVYLPIHGTFICIGEENDR